MDWTVVISVILGLFLFKVLQGIITLVFGLFIASRQKVGEINTTKPRGDFL